jgi:flagellin
MVLSISTNTSAINVQRNLNEANEAAASSLAKLSSGSRVPTAKDDAASLAIGSRVEAEIAGLKQASINASQATSLLQIADGAYGEINDILVRQSTLAIQSASGQLSDSERAIIQSEFSNLTSEVNRIADDTEFNGNQLLKGGAESNVFNEATAGSAAALGISIEGDANKTTNGNVFDVSYDGTAGTETITLENETTGEIFKLDITEALDAVAGTGADLTNDETLTLKFEDAGIELTLNKDFARATVIAADSIEATVVDVTSSSASFDFKVGTGTAAQDDITVTVAAADATTLGTNALDVSTQAGADTAVGTIKSAIDTLQNNRAEVGASLSRLDFASSNLAVAIENQSAAKSGLLDVDVASETTEFASQQVIVQAGVSLLAQANQQPSQLLKLIG